MLHSPMTDSIGYEIKSINNIIKRKMISAATEGGVDKVTLMHGWIICFLSDNEKNDVYQKDIETTFSIARSTVTNILKLMEKKGYIERVSVDSDARLKKLVLTEQGRRINNIIRNSVMSNEKMLDSILTNEEKDTFLCLIRKLRQGLEGI